MAEPVGAHSVRPPRGGRTLCALPVRCTRPAPRALPPAPFRNRTRNYPTNSFVILCMRSTNLFQTAASIAAMRTTLLVCAAVLAAALPLRAADDADGHPTITITRAPSGITVDGDLSEPAWKSATRVEKWWETNPGDNTEPKVKSVGYLMYDDHYFYAGFELDDPSPKLISSPFNDRDHISGNTDDYA